VTDAVQAYLEARGLGHVERKILLGGHLDVEGTQAPPWLCVTPVGPVLVGALHDGRGRLVPLGDCAQVGYVRGRFRPALRIEDRSFTVPLAQRSAVERAIALARIRGDNGRPRAEVLVGPGVERPGEVERAWLGATLEPGELSLAWVRSVTQAPIPSDHNAGLAGRWRLLVTDRRVALVAISFLGDAVTRAVPPDEVPESALATGRLAVSVGGVDLVFHRSSSELARAAIELGRLEPRPRRLEAARRAWVTRRPEHRPFVRAVLDAAAAAGDPLADVAALLVGAEGEQPLATRVELAETLRRLAEEEVAADALARLTASWGFSRLATRALLEDLRSHGVQSEPWALHLHRALHDAAPESNRDVVRSTLADLELAEHSLRADARPLAVEVLETRLATLPSETLEELLPPRDADLTTGAGGPALRSRVFELLARARGTPDRPDVRAVTELARLHPLVGDRVRELAAVAAGELRERALAVSAALEPGGLAPRGTAGDGAVARPLGDALLDGILRHPATRRDSPFLARLQTLLASVPVPDVSLLRDYCEQVTAPPHGAAVRAFADAQRALGLGDLLAYVSRGAKGVGVRAYEGRPPFVLIGGQHLTAGDFELSEAELRFALGAELAHLRYGHSRVTSSELWSGALDKGKQGVELALGLVPVLRGWALADKAMRVTSRVPIPAVQRVVDAAQQLQRRVLLSTLRPPASSQDDGLSMLNETLVVAHRMMQLTADRAGLVIAGDVQASLRTMFLLRRDYRAELTIVERRGLAAVLGQRADDGHIAYQDLAIRVAALLAFYLSDEYVRLRAAIAR